MRLPRISHLTLAATLSAMPLLAPPTLAISALSVSALAPPVLGASTLALATFALSGAALAQSAAEAAPVNPSTITVTAEGVTEAVPDMATLSLGVTNEARTAADALSANSEAVAAVLARLTASGVAPRDMQTSGLALNPVWSQYGDSGQSRITGYTVTNGVTVRIRALDGLGAVLDAAVADGANTFNGLTFGLQNPDPAMDGARTAAVTEALRRAALYAEAAGVELGPMLSLTEAGGYTNPQPMFRMEAAMDSGSVPVAGGEVGVTASVTMVFGVN